MTALHHARVSFRSAHFAEDTQVATVTPASRSPRRARSAVPTRTPASDADALRLASERFTADRTHRDALKLALGLKGTTLPHQILVSSVEENRFVVSFKAFAPHEPEGGFLYVDRAVLTRVGVGDDVRYVASEVERHGLFADSYRPNQTASARPPSRRIAARRQRALKVPGGASNRLQAWRRLAQEISRWWRS